MNRTLALLTAAALGLTGCVEPAEESRVTTVTGENRADDPAETEGQPPAGRFYLVAGQQELKADLWTVSLANGTYRRITDHNRVTTISGCPTMVVVAAAQKEVGYVDTLQKVVGEGLEVIEGLGAGTTATPDLDDSCQVLFQTPIPGGGGTTLRKYDPASGQASELASGPYLVGGKWGPTGEILLIERRATGLVFVVQHPDGAREDIAAEVADVGTTDWGKGGWIATEVLPPPSAEFLVNPSTTTLFINPATGERSTLEGWLPVVWSPTGDQLLVTDASDGAQLGVVELPDLTKVRKVGRSKAGPVWDAAWLPAA